MPANTFANPWHPAIHDAKLRRLHAEGLSTTDIAERLGFGRNQIAKRLVKLGLHKPVPKNIKEWSAAEDEQLRSLLAAGFKLSEIAGQMNRSADAIGRRKVTLGIRKATTRAARTPDDMEA